MRSVAILVPLCALALNAQSLKESLIEVLETHPLVQERYENYRAARSDVTIAEAGYYPTLDLSLSRGREDTDKTPRLGLTANTDYDVTQGSVVYRHNLFRGLGTLYRVGEQKERLGAAAYSYLQTLNDTGMQLLGAYVEVVRQKELLTTSLQNVEINDEIFNKVSKLYESGLTTLSEVNKIESSLALARSNAVVRENNLASTRFALERLSGKAPDVEAMEPPVFEGTMPENEAAALDFAMEHNPSLRIALCNIDQADAARKVTRSAFLPEVDVELSRSYSEDAGAYNGEEDQTRAMATVSFNLFNGFADKAAYEKGSISLRQERLRLEELRREVKEALHLAWSSYVKLSEQLKHLENYKEYSLKTLTLYSKEYDLGRRSLLDLLAAQSDYIGAKSQIINTEYDILLARYRVLDAMGVTVVSLLDDGGNYYRTVGLIAPARQE